MAAEQFSPAEHGSLEQPLTRAFMQEQDLGTGLLKIDENEVRWEGEEGRLLSLCYPSIVLHAISRDTAAFPHHCIFLLWERPLEPPAAEDGEEETMTTELRLVPPDADCLEGMFETISEFQKLYPDPELSDSEGEGEEEGESVDLASGDFFTTPEGLDQLTTEGRAVLAHLENIVQLPSPAEFQEMVSNGSKDNLQFEDAD